MRKEFLYVRGASLCGKRGGGAVVQGCRAGNFVFVGAQTGFDDDGKLTGIADPAAQTRQAIANIKCLMEMAGGRLDDVVKIIVHVRDRAHWTQVSAMIAEAFGEPGPVRTGITVHALAHPEALVSILAWGVVDGHGLKKELLYARRACPFERPDAGAIAQGYRAGNFVFMGGQTGVDLNGKLVGSGDPAAQARQALENIKDLMKIAGGSPDDVVKRIVYVPEYAYRTQVYPVLSNYPPTPRTGLVVDGLSSSDLLMTIDAWGFIDDSELRKYLLVPGRGIDTQGYTTGNIVLMAGQPGFDPDGRLAAGDPAPQTRQALKNIEQLMGAAGGTLEDVVILLVCVTDETYWREVAPVLVETLGRELPIGAGIVVKALARREMLVEIIGWGVVDN